MSTEWKMVPVDPTEVMRQRGAPYPGPDGWNLAEATYRAMLSAAPDAPGEPVDAPAHEAEVLTQSKAMLWGHPIGSREWCILAEKNEWATVAKISSEARGHLNRLGFNLSTLSVAINLAEARAKVGWIEAAPAPDLSAIRAEERRKAREEAALTCKRLASIFLQDGKASEARALEGAAVTIRALATEGK